MAMHTAQNNQGQLPDPPMPGGGGQGQGHVPHGPMGGQSAGSMNNQLPIQQMTGREDMSADTRPVGGPMPMQGAMGGGGGGGFASGPNFQPSQQQVAQAAAYQEAVRHQQMERARAEAEAKMRSIAKEETRGQAIAYVALGMCIVILGLFISGQRGLLPSLATQ